MDQKLRKHLDDIFSPYQGLKAIEELKEELYYDLREKLNELKNNGYDEDAAYRMAIDSIGEISEIVETINTKTRELQQMVGMDLSKSDLKNSDLKGVKVIEGKFNYSDLKGSDFSYSDLTNSSFKCSNLENAIFDGANLTGAKMVKSSFKGASFKNAVLDNTDFNCSDLSGLCLDKITFNGTLFNFAGLKGTSFRNAVFNNVSFKTEVKKAIFDGAIMDKVTYAILKGYKANLDNVTVI